MHPTPAACQVLANKLMAMVDDMLSETASSTTISTGTNDNKNRAAHREPWIVSFRTSGQAPDSFRPWQ